MSVETPAAPEPVEAPAEGAKPEEPLGAPGLSALKSERERADAAEKAARDALAKVQEYEDRDKSEAQKQQEALERAQRELAELTVAKTRAEVAAARGVPADLLNGSTQEELEASADALIAFKGEQQVQKLIIPNEGSSPSSRSTGSTADAFAAFMEDKL